MEDKSIDPSMDHGKVVEEEIRESISLSLNNSNLDNEELGKGIKHDDYDELLTRQGYKPELTRNFSFWSLLGVAFGLTNSWIGIGGSMGDAVSSGGPFMVIYGIIVAFCFVMPVGVTLAEFVSMFPNSGGQYYWTFQLAKPQWARFLAFMTGNFGYLGSVFTCSAISLTTSQALIATYQLVNSNYEIEPWHVVVCSIAITCFVSIFNCWEKPLPYITTMAFVISLLSFTIITLTALISNRGHYNTASFVFVEPINISESMIGITFLVMLTAPTWALAGIDASTHMAEELPNPAVTIPRAIIATICVGATTAFVFCVALMFCIRDVTSVMNAELPLLEIIYQAMNYNSNGAIALEAFAIATAIFCNISANTWQARICWSFARDNGIPGSQIWSKIHPATNVPINAHLFSNFLSIIINLVYLGSSNAYNSIITASVEILYFSYIIPTICLLCKNRSKVTHHGPFWLQRYHIGLICNYLTCFWVVFCLIFFSLPYDLPATAGNMNYVSAVYGVVTLYIVIYWYIKGKKEFVQLEDRLFTLD